MVDPFASTNPATATNQNPSQVASTDVFGGVPDIFSDMAATAFQPIDPETWRPTEHTPETLDPFLRDENKNVISSDSPANFGNDIWVNQSIHEISVEEPVEQDHISSDVPQEDPFLVSPSPSYMPPVPEEDSVVQETVSSIDQVDTDKSEETNASFEAMSSLDVPQESVLELSEEEQNDTIIPPQQIDLTDGMATVESDALSDAETTQMSDHYDPFVDTISDISVDNPVVVDDPFLADPVLEPEMIPSQEESVEPDNSFGDRVDSSLPDTVDEEVSYNQQEPDDIISTTTNESPIQDVAVPELEPVDPFLLDHDAVDTSLASEESVDITIPTESIPADDELSAVAMEPVVSEDSDENQQSYDIPAPQEVSVGAPDYNQVIEETPVAHPQEVATAQETVASQEIIEPSQEQSDSISELEPQEPSMLQGLVEGMLDPFSSASPVKDDWLEAASIKEELTPEAIISDEDVHEIDPVVEQVAPAVASIVENEEVIDDQESQSSTSEPTVNEDEQDMQKSWLSDVFVKFQELLQAIYRVHDGRGGHDAFTVVGADNDALYITYSFAIEASAEQAIIVTKKSTNRNADDSIDTHVLRFAVNVNSLVEVYVDGVLLFVEDQLVDNVKAKMQLMDKFNKFIFLINQFIQDSVNQVSWGAIASAKEEFGDF